MDQGLIRALRGSDAGARDDAVRTLYDRLRSVARHQVGAKVDRPGFDPSSIVVSVLAKRLDRALELSSDDDHLRASLARAVKNKVIDRARRDRSRSLAPGDTERHADDLTPAAAAIGREDDQQAFDRFSAFVDRLVELAANDREREMIALYAIGGYTWDTVAAELGSTPGAARTAFTRLRARTLPEVFAPLAQTLDGEAWAITQALLIDRAKPEVAGELIGRDAAIVQKVYEDRVVPALRSHFGPASLVIIQRLIGK